MRVGIYICTPSKDSPLVQEDQLKLLRTKTIQNYWQVSRIYRDTISVLKTERPAYQQMLNDAEHHRFDVLVFWALAQLSQNSAGSTVQLLSKFSCWGIGFCSYTEQYLDSCHALKDIIVSVVDAIARQDKVYISARTRIGLAKQQHFKKPGSKGRLGPGRPPINFDWKHARALRAAKASYAEIAAVCGISETTVWRFFNRKDQKS